MIETALGLENVAEICATPGLDGLYVGPSDLCLAVGGRFPGDPAVAGPFDAAVELIAQTAKKAGIAAGIHTPDGETAQRMLAAGYAFATVASDLSHLEGVASAHLATARA
jgi:4-hydroxy-2-oxoheptanedioate aldolase